MNPALAKAYQRFLEITGNLDGWATIGELVDICDSQGFFSGEFLAEAEGQAKKATIRRLIKQIKGSDNAPEWASVVTVGEQGKPQRVYKQETLFDIADYQQVVDYHADRARYHKETAKGYALRCKQRFGVQLRFAFEEHSQRKPKPR